jgi:hypothetical protein
MTPPCNACDCHLPLDADDLCSRCAATCVEFDAIGDEELDRYTLDAEC